MVHGSFLLSLVKNSLVVKEEMLFGPRREKTCLRGFVNNTGTDQPAHAHSLISAFVIHFLESTIFDLESGRISIF